MVLAANSRHSLLNGESLRDSLPRNPYRRDCAPVLHLTRCLLTEALNQSHLQNYVVPDLIHSIKHGGGAGMPYFVPGVVRPDLGP